MLPFTSPHGRPTPVTIAAKTIRLLRHFQRRLLLTAVLAASLLPPLALALLPPVEVECCQRKDFTSEQCRRFALDAPKCEQANARWQETYRKFSELMYQKQPAAPPALVVARIEPRLYYSHSGTFSAIIDDKLRLFNVIIGEGGVPEPSNALRVDVVLKGAPGSFDAKAEVKLEVTDSETGKRIATQTATTGTLSERGEYHAIFLLQKTGCIPLKLVAGVTGSDAKKSVIVPFVCGE